MLHLLLAITDRLYHVLGKNVYRYARTETQDLKISTECDELQMYDHSMTILTTEIYPLVLDIFPSNRLVLVFFSCEK